MRDSAVKLRVKKMEVLHEKRNFSFKKKVGGREAEERMPFIYMQLWLSGREKKESQRERILRSYNSLI